MIYWIQRDTCYPLKNLAQSIKWLLQEKATIISVKPSQFLYFQWFRIVDRILRQHFSSLKVGEIDLMDRKCNNKTLSLFFRQINMGHFNCGIIRGDTEVTLRKHSFSFYLLCPVAPKVHETHFKMVSAIDPVKDLFHQRFKFDVEPCVFCSSQSETIEHLLFYCSLTKLFWSNVHPWPSLNIDNIPWFHWNDIFYGSFGYKHFWSCSFQNYLGKISYSHLSVEKL